LEILVVEFFLGCVKQVGRLGGSRGQLGSRDPMGWEVDMDYLLG
jgi:hypothetical protein